MKGRWGIELESSWDWEEERLRRVRPPQPTITENANPPETLLVDSKGQPLIQRKPRAIGFRPPTQD
jgi:hypothetical protein